MTGAVPRNGHPRSYVCWGAALVLVFMITPLLATPAAAIGATVDLVVTPPRTIGTPSAAGPGAANLTADATVFGASSSAGTLVFTVTNDQDWDATPSSRSYPVPSGGGRFTFEFQIMVPPDAVAGVNSGVEVRAEYRVGPATLSTAVAGASVEAGKFYGASIRRVSASEPMSPGRAYVIEYEVLNEGNAGSSLTFEWTDPALISRLKADFEAPTTLSVGGHGNVTAQFRITPQGTTPDGAVEVPVMMVITDRTGLTYGQVNFTIHMEFDNLPIYPGILPRLDLEGVSALLGWIALLLLFWLVMNAGIAFTRRKDYDEAEGSVFFQAYTARLSHTLLYRGLRRAVGGGRKGKPKRARARNDG